MGRSIGDAAMKAAMCRNTASKHATGPLPSERRKERDYRTREDPFEEDWTAIRERLEAAPELEAKSIFEELMAQHPERYSPGQLRTLQRRVRRWRAQSGPDKEVFFAQEHRPGEAAQTDFTHANELGVTIAGRAFDHMLCHFALPFSNWSWATICFSESMVALRHGVQEAVFRLGKVPTYHQTDNSTAATHEVGNGDRDFNARYVELMEHLGMTPRTIAVGKSNQNGDVEALNRALKSSLAQHLLIRASRDFESVEDYRGWLESVLKKRNLSRGERLTEELAVMSSVPVRRMIEHDVVDVLVTRGSTIRVARNTYSVPSRLIGERVRVHAYEHRLKVYLGGELQVDIERLRGEGGHRIDYRHMVPSLMKKPGGFRNYRYVDSLFPTVMFRRAYDELVQSNLSEWRTDVEYIRILHLAATTMECLVEAALCDLMTRGEVPREAAVRKLVQPPDAECPELEKPEVDIAGYDDLLTSDVGGAA
jgi:hypothetical protein